MRTSRHTAAALSGGLLLVVALVGTESCFSQEVTRGCQKIFNAITTVPGSPLYAKLGPV